jgi:hypothetical protein
VALRRDDPPSKESYHLCKNYYETEEEARAQQRAVEPLVNEILCSGIRMVFKLQIINLKKASSVSLT